MWVTALALVIFLLYFYYMAQSDSLSVSKPSTPYVPSKPTFTQQLELNGSTFQYSTHSTVDWKVDLPNEFKIQDETITLGDVCHGQPNGFRVLATGKPLYEYLKRDKTLENNVQFESNATTTLRDKRVFYFTCQGSQIDKLHMCPPGHLFTNQQCEPIQPCSGEKDGKRFANPYELNLYYECEKGTRAAKKCPSDEIFMHDKCVNTSDASVYCQFHKEPKILNSKTLLVCRDNQMTYDTCPEGFRYFDTAVCESDACFNIPDGTLIPLPDQQNGPFTFSPGYRVCMGGKVEGVNMCSPNWDPYLSEGDDLTHLPLVFDGKKCSVPSFGKNVHSTDPEIVVPAYHFLKHVPNWKYSSQMDRVTGYEFKETRKRVHLDPGQRINKRFKRESACDNTVQKVPMGGQPDAYYDCQTETVEKCPANHYFDTKLCQPRRENVFSFEGLDFFSFDSLSISNWIKPWNYKLPTKTCEASETYLEAFNVCSHPECAKYPFLSLIPSFKLSLEDGSQCLMENERLIKKESLEKRLYWSQRPVEKTYDDPCEPGNRLRSGNFVWDSTIYMTCDENEPFLFCPSSSTTGIELIQGKKFACMAPSMSFTMPSYSTAYFTKNQVKRIVWGDPTPIVKIDGLDVRIPEEGYEIDDKKYPQGFNLQTFRNKVVIEYQYQLTYPPDVVLTEDLQGRVSRFGGGFLMKRGDFTTRSLGFPTYTLNYKAIDFEME